jgi:glycosyltransferase involved in cell wall biosynthesis
MRVLMATNTFTPHVGGVARSVQSFADQLRAMGHGVLVVAPEFPDAPEHEANVVRLPAIQNFNNTQFSVPLVLPGMLLEPIEAFKPDVVHAHHPFLLGSTALRIGAAYSLPVVFTHHTRYDTYTHYLSLDTPTVQRIAVEMAAGFCNLCQAVIAPSESIAQLLREHHVQSPIEVIPTGVDLRRFAQADGSRARPALKLPADAIVIGHVGRLAQEKNLGFLAEAVATYLKREPRAWFLVVGSGPAEAEIEQRFSTPDLQPRLRLAGTLEGQALVDAYAAMDVFAFASQSETQGMVLTEAMAAGVPVVALDACGVRDVLRDGVNGRMLAEEDAAAFAAALGAVIGLPDAKRRELRSAARATAEHFSLPNCAARLAKVYESVIAQYAHQERDIDDSPWARSLRWLETELAIVSNLAGAVGTALFEEES